MARDEVKYQSSIVYVGPSPATGFHFSSGTSGVSLVQQLHRVDTFNDAFDIPRENVTQFGQLRPFAREVVDSPTPTFDFEYYLTNGINEERLGLVIDGQTSCISGILNGTQDEKNYFGLFVPEGNDAVGFNDRTQHIVVGLGNGFINNLEFTASVGEFARASVSVEGANYTIQTGSSGIAVPAINTANGTKIVGVNYALPPATSGEAGMPKVIKYGDVTLDLSDAVGLLGATLDGAGSAHLQSFSLNIPLDREPLNRLGTQFAYSRKINFPIEASLTLEANVAELNTGNLIDIINSCNEQTYDFEVGLRACVTNSSKNDVMKFIVKGATLDSESFSLGVGDRRTVSIPFTVLLSGPQDTERGVFISGSHND